MIVIKDNVTIVEMVIIKDNKIINEMVVIKNNKMAANPSGEILSSGS